MSTATYYPEPAFEGDHVEGAVLLAELIQARGHRRVWLDDQCSGAITQAFGETGHHLLPARQALEAALADNDAVTLVLAADSLPALLPRLQQIATGCSMSLLIIVTGSAQGHGLPEDCFHRHILAGDGWLSSMDHALDLMQVHAGMHLVITASEVLQGLWPRNLMASVSTALHFPETAANSTLIMPSPAERTVALIGALPPAWEEAVHRWADREAVLCLSLYATIPVSGQYRYPLASSCEGKDVLGRATQVIVLGEEEGDIHAVIPEDVTAVALSLSSYTPFSFQHGLDVQGDEEFYLDGRARLAVTQCILQQAEKVAIKQVAALDVLTRRMDHFLVDDRMAAERVWFSDEQRARTRAVHFDDQDILMAQALVYSSSRAGRLWVIMPPGMQADWEEWKVFWSRCGEGRSLCLLQWHDEAPLPDPQGVSVERSTPGAIDAVRSLLHEQTLCRISLKRYLMR
ncbi:hypothetical protein [Larsenimonas rhizosphaerae]|uniref:Uncharacterized protein n=1 Tax=Larsenimonas rhizosphaerae TaxID=2944682 RepID=A0AA41ZDX1_9GAMM|nr:hypothetical protein [Larsenimonas rhizosphaerae]MCX2523047.1 hypothetical protein [Larsenimonas rhizosphaerae]